MRSNLKFHVLPSVDNGEVGISSRCGNHTFAEHQHGEPKKRAIQIDKWAGKVVAGFTRNREWPTLGLRGQINRKVMACRVMKLSPGWDAIFGVGKK